MDTALQIHFPDNCWSCPEWRQSYLHQHRD